MGTLASFGGSGLLLAGDRSLLAFGLGRGPADRLPWQERSRCSVNVTSVSVNLRAGAEDERPNTQEDTSQVHRCLSSVSGAGSLRQAAR